MLVIAWSVMKRREAFDPGRPLRVEFTSLREDFMGFLILRWLLSAGLLLSFSFAYADPPSGVVSTVQNNTASVAPFIQYRSVFIQYQGFNEQPVLPWRKTNDAVGKIGGWRFYATEASLPDAADKSSTESKSDAHAKQPAVPSINTDSHSEHGRKP